MTVEDRGLWRRLGWTCFVRDRVVLTGVRHPPTIELRQFHLSPLETSDFGISTLSQEVLQAFPDCEILQKPDIQVSFAQAYMEKVKLCIILDGIFTTKYHEVAPRHGVVKENSVVLLERVSEDLEDMSRQYSTRLRQWQDELPNVVQCGASPMHALTQGDGILRLHQSLLHMLYHTVFLMLYSPREVLYSSPSSSLRRCMRLASGSITHTMEDLQGHDLVRFLPAASVTMIKEWCIRLFLDCLWYLRQLQDIHKYAVFGAEFLIHAAHKLRLPIHLSSKPRPFEFGVWAHAHNPERFLHTDLDNGSNTISDISEAVHDLHQPMPHEQYSGTVLAQHCPSPITQYKLGWNEYLMPYSYTSYDMLFADTFGTTFPTALLDSWVVDHFEPLVNE
ncbi:hypothetical protein BDV33DRAFT_210503 [Aspergillus novoparasiticus]|uniref:Transcription factor domain-containing protein n=1 Tax=Aspergillus novoparasiticus TaxID=986946 RepID=A0A5N6E776_9EURO|nr:hypothetical protein BDV33DRAFT_210503 [Aspergillus novoparasiticus]